MQIVCKVNRKSLTGSGKPSLNFSCSHCHLMYLYLSGFFYSSNIKKDSLEDAAKIFCQAINNDNHPQVLPEKTYKKLKQNHLCLCDPNKISEEHAQGVQRAQDILEAGLKQLGLKATFTHSKTIKQMPKNSNALPSITKKDLAEALRKRQYALGQCPAEYVAAASDEDMIDSYVTCSQCKERWISKEDVDIIIETCKDAEDFIEKTAQYAKACGKIKDMSFEEVEESPEYTPLFPPLEEEKIETENPEVAVLLEKFKKDLLLPGGCMDKEMALLVVKIIDTYPKCTIDTEDSGYDVSLYGQKTGYPNSLKYYDHLESLFDEPDGETEATYMSGMGFTATSYGKHFSQLYDNIAEEWAEAQMPLTHDDPRWDEFWDALCDNMSDINWMGRNEHTRVRDWYAFGKSIKKQSRPKNSNSNL
jgi:hypothetical protein